MKSHSPTLIAKLSKQTFRMSTKIQPQQKDCSESHWWSVNYVFRSCGIRTFPEKVTRKFNSKSIGHGKQINNFSVFKLELQLNRFQPCTKQFRYRARLLNKKKGLCSIRWLCSRFPFIFYIFFLVRSSPLFGSLPVCLFFMYSNIIVAVAFVIAAVDCSEQSTFECVPVLYNVIHIADVRVCRSDVYTIEQNRCRFRRVRIMQIVVSCLLHFFLSCFRFYLILFTVNFELRLHSISIFCDVADLMFKV